MAALLDLGRAAGNESDKTVAGVRLPFNVTASYWPR